MLDDEEVSEIIGISRGLTAAAIDSYTVCYTFCGLSQSLEDETRGKCTVCMEEFVKGECLRCLPCLHSYHMPCIDKWLSLSQACPVCKHNVTATTSPRFPGSPTGQTRCPTDTWLHGQRLVVDTLHDFFLFFFLCVGVVSP